MNENKQDQTDPRLDTPSEANREKHINFREVEEESAQNFAINKNTSERQKEWQHDIKEGEEEKLKSDQRKNTSSMPMDKDDTIGVP